MSKRMSIEAHTVYVERRTIERERTMQRRQDRRSAAIMRGVFA